MGDNGYAITTENLTMRFGRKYALREINARVPTGSIYGLLGPNGAGKTTFVRVLLNLIIPSRGTAVVLGYDVRRKPVEIRKGVGHVAALQPLWEWMTVREFAGLMKGCYPRWEEEPVRKIIADMGIGMKDKLEHLSRGQRALVSLAVAIGHRPDLLLLDEALTGLDPIARREVLRNIIDVMHEEGRTVFITGQDLPDMERIIDYVGFVVGGRLIAESPLDDLKARVKRIRVEHPPDARVEPPAGARNISRGPRETEFTVQDYSPAMLEAFAARGLRAEALSLGLEDIFIDLAQGRLGAEAK